MGRKRERERAVEEGEKTRCVWGGAWARKGDVRERERERERDERAHTHRKESRRE